MVALTSHPAVVLSLLLGLSLGTGAAHAMGQQSLAALAAGLTLWATVSAVKVCDHPHAATQQAKLGLLAYLSFLLPFLAASIPLAPFLFSESSRLISTMANVTLVAFAAPYAVLFWSVRTKLPHLLVVVLAAAVAVGGVAATGWMLHEGSEEGVIRSGLAAVATVLSLALAALCFGLRGARESLHLRVLFYLCSLLFAACLAATAATQATIDDTSDSRLQLLQPVSAVATVASVVPLLAVVFLRNEQKALDFGYSTHAASATAVCRILVKIFALSTLLFSAAFGFFFTSSSFWPFLNFVCLLSSIAAMQLALSYVRFKERPLRRQSMCIRCVLLILLAVALAVGEIALIVVCQLCWVHFLPSSSFLSVGAICVTAHKLHLVMVVVIDRLRAVLRPFSLYPGLAMLAVSSSLALYGELTQFFPEQSRSPAVWLAVSLAAATAAQLCAIPAVECFKREAEVEKRRRAELSAAFRADAKQRIVDKRAAKARKMAGAAAAAALTVPSDSGNKAIKNVAKTASTAPAAAPSVSSDSNSLAIKTAASTAPAAAPSVLTGSSKQETMRTTASAAPAAVPRSIEKVIEVDVHAVSTPPAAVPAVSSSNENAIENVVHAASTPPAAVPAVHYHSSNDEDAIEILPMQ